MVKRVCLFALDACDAIYSRASRLELAKAFQEAGSAVTGAEVERRPELLETVEVLFTGWGAPRLDAELLRHASRLQAVFYAAGSVRPLVTPAFWERSILLSSAALANAVPVAEYTLAQIILGLKQVHRLSRAMHRRQPRRDPDRWGVYGARVGLVGLGAIGCAVARRLQCLDVSLFAYDPALDEDRARELGVVPASLEELFRGCDLVSLHAPLLERTRGMITGHHFASMPSDAVFVNTSRGGLVCEKEMVEVLRRRPDLTVILDVTDPEPPEADSPLYDLENVHLTPHVAGSAGRECHRLGEAMVDEAMRFAHGRPLLWRVREDAMEGMP